MNTDKAMSISTSVQDATYTHLHSFINLQVITKRAMQQFGASSGIELQKDLVAILQDISDILELSIPFDQLNHSLFENIKQRLQVCFERRVALLN